MNAERIVGKSGLTVTQARAKFSTEHYNPIRAKAEQEHLLRVLARCPAPKPAPVVERPRKVYGPHSPEDAPTTVTIFGLKADVEAPIPDVLVRQRQQLNALAHRGRHV